MTGEALLSKNAVHIFLKKNGKRVAKGTLQNLEEDTRTLLLKAVKRAEANDRSTIMPRDL